MENLTLTLDDIEPGDIVAVDGIVWKVDELRSGWVRVYIDGAPTIQKSIRLSAITSHTREDKTGTIEYIPPVPDLEPSRRQKLFRLLKSIQNSSEYRKGLNHAVQAAKSVRVALSTRMPGETWEVLS